MQALIIRDRFDNIQIANQLVAELKSLTEKINIVEIESMSQWETAKIQLVNDEPCIYFPNIFLRYTGISLYTLSHFHKMNKEFSVLTSGLEVVSFIPNKVTVNYSNNSIIFSNYFTIRDIKINYTKPNEEPIIFLYTHNRHEYLKLTLNSLNHSMLDKFPVKLLLNQPTPKVREVALSYEHLEHIEIFEISPNSIFSAINLSLQWFNPKKFIIMEDDFILPLQARTRFPNWAFQFMDRLNHFDIVGWPWSLDNSPFYYTNRCIVDHVQTDWIYKTKDHKAIDGYYKGAHCLAVNTDHFIKSFKNRETLNPYYVAFDGDMQSYSARMCVTASKGYHIGFNQVMDGYPPRTVNPHPKEFKMVSLKTNEERTFNVEDLYKMEPI